MRDRLLFYPDTGTVMRAFVVERIEQRIQQDHRPSASRNQSSWEFLDHHRQIVQLFSLLLQQFLISNAIISTIGQTKEAKLPNFALSSVASSY
jgi:hypothetical protein